MSHNSKQLSLGFIEKAAVQLSPVIRKTPVEWSPVLSKKLGASVWLKLECLQITGSFKVRGALFALNELNEKERQNGVATCSAGNHGKALAFACKRQNIPVTIYVPSTIDSAKLEGMVALGAEVIRSSYEGYDDTEKWAQTELQGSGKKYLSPYDDTDVMVGNGGTLALETISQLPKVKSYLLPVGGGGLAAGFSFYAKTCVPEVRVIGCQLESSPGLKRSLEEGRAVTELPPVKTIAGGLEGGIGVNSFSWLKDRIDDVVCVSEQAIKQAFVWFLENHQYLIEPSSAVTVAALLDGRVSSVLGETCLVISGRNVSRETLHACLEELT